MKLLKQLSTLLILLIFTQIATAQISPEEGVIETNHELEDEAYVETVTHVVLKTEIIKVQGISKDKDVSNIVKQLKAMDGVKNCRASRRGKFFVTFDPQKMNRQKIKSKVEQIPSNVNSKEKPFKIKE